MNTKNTVKSISIMLILLTVLCSCDQDKIIYSDQYVFGQDSQYGLTTLFDSGIAQSEDGYYFFSGPTRSFLYFYDNKSKQSLPLCNKPDCLHANEPDKYKIANCNAFIPSASYLKYFMDRLYYVYEESSDELKQSIYEVSGEGTNRKQLFTCKDFIKNIQIHRGFIYFYTSDEGTVPGEEETTKTTYRLYRMKLNQAGAKPEFIDEGTRVYGSIGDVICYGNSVYYLVRYEQDKHMVSYIFKYDIVSGNKTIVVENCFPQFTIFNEKLVFMRNKQVCYSSLDGESVKVFSDNLGMFYANSKYLLIDNMMYAAVLNMERNVMIFSRDFKPVKTVSLKSMKAAAYGCSDEFFFIPKDSLYNEFGEIMSLQCIALNQSADEMKLETFHEFVPRVPFKGINTKQ